MKSTLSYTIIKDIHPAETLMHPYMKSFDTARNRLAPMKIGKDREWCILDGVVSIGRSCDCTVQLPVYLLLDLFQLKQIDAEPYIVFDINCQHDDLQ